MSGKGPRHCAADGCNVILPSHHSPGAPPRFCLSHRPKGNRRRDVAVKLAQGDVAAAAELAQATGLAVNRSQVRSSLVRRLAIAIRTNRGDLKAAAADCGVEAREDLESLLADAAAKYADVIADKPGAFARLGEEISFVMLSRADDPTMSGQQAASAFAAIAQGTERMNLGARKAYTNVYVVVPGLTASRLDEPATVDGREPNGGTALAKVDGSPRGGRVRRTGKALSAKAKGRSEGYWRAPRTK